MEWEGVEHFLSDRASAGPCVGSALSFTTNRFPSYPSLCWQSDAGVLVGSWVASGWSQWPGRLNRWVAGWSFKPRPHILQGRERGVKNWVQSPVTHGLIRCAYVVKPLWKPLRPGLGEFQERSDWPTSNNVSGSRWPDSFVKRIFVD